MAAPTITASRVAFDTGAPDYTGGEGILWSDGVLAYRLELNSELTDVIQGSMDDVAYRWSENAGYAVNAMDSAPTVSSVTPATGSTAGGTSVTIAGTNLAGATPGSVVVKFDTNNATSVVVANDGKSITCTTPAHSAGAVAVSVTTTAGTGNKASAFTYTA